MTHPEIEPLRQALVDARARYAAAPLHSTQRDRAWEVVQAAVAVFNARRGALIRDLGLETF